MEGRGGGHCSRVGNFLEGLGGGRSVKIGNFVMAGNSHCCLYPCLWILSNHISCNYTNCFLI